MYEVTYSVNGIIHKMIIDEKDYNQIFNTITNMYGSGTVQIINVRRK